MTRRIVLAIMGTVVAALLLTGAGTLLLGAWRSREITRQQLQQEVGDLAAGLDSLSERGGDAPRPAALAVVARSLRLDGVEVLLVGPNGKVVGQPPPGVELDDVDPAGLAPGEEASGNHGNLVWAAASAATTRGSAVVVATRRANPGLRPAVGWFLVSSAVAVGLGAIVAVTLSRRITRPLRRATAATHRLADGELTTRLSEPASGRTDEVADLTRSINSMASGLERSKGLEQQFLLSVSHDLRTPLTSITGYAEAIADGTAPDHEAAARVILSEAHRLERLVGDLLDLARLQARTFSLARRTVDLAEIARDVALAFGPAALAGGKVVSVEAPAPALVLGDPDRLAQVVGNLVQNALGFARATVSVGVHEEDREAVLTVDDDGPGIAPEDLPHVFERLYVARHQPVRAESGSGLGLAIVRELVGAMGGRVGAERAPGGGARLVIHLPVVLPPPAGLASRDTPPPT